MSNTDTSLLDPTPSGAQQYGFAPPKPAADQAVAPPPQMSDADIQKMVQQRQAITDKSVSDIDALDKRRMALASQPTPHAAHPQLGDIPKPPDTKPLNVFKEAQAPLIFATVFGAAMMKNHGMGAMAAATGFLEGWQKGDQERMDRERQKWDDNVNAIIKENGVQKERYDMALNDTRLSQQDKMAQISAIASSINDSVIKNSMATGNFDFAYNAIQKRDEAARKLYDTNIKFGFGGTPTQQAFRQFEAETIETKGRRPTSDEIVDWQQKQRPARSALAMAMQQARVEHPEWTAKQIVDFGAQSAAYMAAQRTLAIRGANISVGGKELVQFAGPALAASELVPRGTWTPINALNLNAQKLESNPDLRELSNRTAAIITAYAQVITRNGGITVHAQQRAQDLLNLAESPEAYERGIQTLINEADLAEKAPDIARQQLRDLFMQDGGGAAKPTLGAPPAPARIKVNSVEEAEKLAPGTKYETPDGGKYTR